MKYYGIDRGYVDWVLFCLQSEVDRLGLSEIMELNQKRWETPETINMYVDTRYIEDVEDYSKPRMASTMLWQNGIHVRNLKDAKKPYNEGFFISEELYEVIKDFKSPNCQFIPARVENVMEDKWHNYYLYYILYQPNFMCNIDIPSTIFNVKNRETKEIDGEISFKDFNSFIEEEDVNYAEIEYIPKEIVLKSDYDFVNNGFNFTVSERLRQAIEAAGIEACFYDLDYEVRIGGNKNV